jgi:HSP20 family protein
MTFNLPSLLRRRNYMLRNQDDIVNIFDDVFNAFCSLPPAFLSSKEGDLLSAIDISETDSDHCLDVKLSGINKQDIDLKIENNILTIKGQKETTFEDKKKNYYIQERYSGLFQRSISLPINVLTSKVDAKYENGVLHIKIPKK